MRTVEEIQAELEDVQQQIRDLEYDYYQLETEINTLQTAEFQLERELVEADANENPLGQ